MSPLKCILLSSLHVKKENGEKMFNISISILKYHNLTLADNWALLNLIQVPKKAYTSCPLIG
ncbi:predicted protein [Sclerotinia sclerotiorum 1980 UF-70]|uniref:Uncharacterized protein n=1 Tax=Sclerotinia sclerotiorum (strain ATCC 18683 / 1980 / Ss-1) TaxID=665079 RepID=A7EMN1_SCLS1|nr:predicted protein [Sclerotinia sclerotiorum 1980 UF-70]EDO04097.1 predicted protein [Sclerotinia sclerotiorum 1980 UF-70]